MIPPTFPEGGDERPTALGAVAEELRRQIDASKARPPTVNTAAEQLCTLLQHKSAMKGPCLEGAGVVD
jgi:hypothetical protein